MKLRDVQKKLARKFEWTYFSVAKFVPAWLGQSFFLNIPLRWHF